MGNAWQPHAVVAAWMLSRESLAASIIASWSSPTVLGVLPGDSEAVQGQSTIDLTSASAVSETSARGLGRKGWEGHQAFDRFALHLLPFCFLFRRQDGQDCVIRLLVNLFQ